MNAPDPIRPLDRDGLRLSGTPLAQARRILVVTPGAVKALADSAEVRCSRGREGGSGR